MKLKLVKADIKYKNEIISYKEEFINNNESLDGAFLLGISETPEEFINSCNKFNNKNTCPKDKVPSQQYFAVIEGQIVGMIDLRFHINHPILGLWGGHIGYSVKKSKRRKGYAKEMLRQVLVIAKDLGMDNILITCSASNIASEKTILANNGKYEKSVLVDKELIKRFIVKF